MYTVYTHKCMVLANPINTSQCCAWCAKVESEGVCDVHVCF
jgi:hypothetical protein